MTGLTTIIHDNTEMINPEIRVLSEVLKSPFVYKGVVDSSNCLPTSDNKDGDVYSVKTIIEEDGEEKEKVFEVVYSAGDWFKLGDDVNLYDEEDEIPDTENNTIIDVHNYGEDKYLEDQSIGIEAKIEGGN